METMMERAALLFIVIEIRMMKDRAALLFIVIVMVRTGGVLPTINVVQAMSDLHL